MIENQSCGELIRRREKSLVRHYPYFSEGKNVEEAKDFGLAVVFLYEETITILLPMKKLIFITICVCATGVILSIAQPGPPGMPPPMQNGTGKYVWVAETNNLPKFDLDFS